VATVVRRGRLTAKLTANVVGPRSPVMGWRHRGQEHDQTRRGPLIAECIDPDRTDAANLADARTREGVPVWALVSYLRPTAGDAGATPDPYRLARASVAAARAYYRGGAGRWTPAPC
jgi:hypothetical protein